MPSKNFQRVSESGIYCHVYNKGIENRNIFAEDADYQIFLGFLEDYLSDPKARQSTKQEFTVNGRVFTGVPHQPKNYLNKVELIAYSLKPDHFHLLLHQKTSKSLQAFIRSLCTRYSIYFNKKYNRVGSLFQGPYKSAIISDKSDLPLLTRYLHKHGGHSTYPEYLGTRETPWIETKVVLPIKNSKGNYKDFVEKYEPNQKEKELLEKITIEDINQHLERSDLEREHDQEVRIRPWLRIPELAAAGTAFVLLISLGVRNINAHQTTSATLGTKTSAIPFISEIMPQSKKMLIIKGAEGIVDIREEPTADSKEIGQAKNGDTFKFISYDSGWYEVELPNGSTGFLLSIYVETEGATN